MPRKRNPESILTERIRNILALLRCPNFKHWGGPMGEKGIPDIIGVIPDLGQALFIEIKTPTGKVSDDQAAFLERYKAAGALAFVARSVEDVIKTLAGAGYSRAEGMFIQLGGAKVIKHDP